MATDGAEGLGLLSALPFPVMEGLECLALSLQSISSADKGDTTDSPHGMMVIYHSHSWDQIRTESDLEEGGFTVAHSSRVTWQQENEAAGQITSTARKYSADKK